ncbi:MAG: FkbM family methyltransferase [Chitinophagales bacterium]|nr:FkbM family methyltransferase [Chitinophagales bacterium]
MNYHQQLEDLLNESESAILNRTEASFDIWADKIAKGGLFLFGGGVFGRKVLKGLKRAGIEVLGFADNNKNAWGTEIEGIKVFSPEEAALNHPQAVFMVTMWSDNNGHPIDTIREQLNSYRATEVISFFHLFWKYPALYMPYFSIDQPIKTLREKQNILNCFSLFQDEASQKEFVAQIKWRLQGDYAGLGAPSHFTQYFPDDLFELGETDVFVDCGAFDGDTLKNFLKKQGNQFAKYYAFEPDPINFEKLNAFAQSQQEEISSKIETGNYAISDERKIIRFNSNGTLQSTSSEDGNIEVQCIAIDQDLKDVHVTYLKMDVEGAEPDILKGAEQMIKRDHPIIAISVYHEFNHLWFLPMMVKNYSNEYSFFLRPHCKASWDLLCYCVPKNRLKKQ